MTRQLSKSIVLLLVLVTRTAFVSDTVLGEWCSFASEKDSEQDFLAFDHKLRMALSKQDAVATAALVKFPLRVKTRTSRFAALAA